MGTVDWRIALCDARAAREGDAQMTRRDDCSLSLRLDNEQYRRLRQFVINHEDQTGQRITHQTILEIALTEYLELNDPPICKR